RAAVDRATAFHCSGIPLSIARSAAHCRRNCFPSPHAHSHWTCGRIPECVRGRNPRSLFVLCECRSEEHCCLLHRERDGGSDMKSLKRQIGLDILADKYSYASDPEYGYTSAQKIPDRWVSTTCGYCSVGCGMFVGVKENRAVAVRGNANHPVNLGKLCPKGLSEHHTLEASNRAKYPLLRKNGKLGP